MQIKKKIIWIAVWCLCVGLSLSAQSIADKKANLRIAGSDLDRETDQFLFRINQEAQDLHAQIQKLYDEAFRLYQANAPQEEYECLLNKINEHKKYLIHLESTWREMAAKDNRSEAYGLWHAPETNLEQLIIDYGSQEYVYLIPPEVGAIKLTIASNLPIPRSSWGGMLEHILNQNGVGIKSLNPYLRQLYLIKQNHSHLKLITNNRRDLETLPVNSRISFVLSPEPSELRRTQLFLEKFINPHTTVLQLLGRDLLLIGQVSDIQDLLKLCDFVATNRGDKEYKILPVSKVKAEEMANILAMMFDQNSNAEPLSSTEGDSKEGAVTRAAPIETSGLRIIVLNHAVPALFIIGTKEEIRKAEEIICNVENQVGDIRDKTVFWYTVKHSDPEELADVLYRIYSLMMSSRADMEGAPVNLNAPNDVVVVQPNSVNNAPQNDNIPLPSPPPGAPGFYQNGTVVNPAPAQPGTFVQKNPNRNRDNFIVDLKTGSIVMVVEADSLPRLKDLIRKLDVPKKMVQIETLLFEKVLARENNFGLNLLRIGEAAVNCHKTGAGFNNLVPACSDFLPTGAGVFEFFLSRNRSDSGIPAFDIAYRFLLSQDDVQINSSPSILTINQTPATIAINEDISINMGAYPVDTPNAFAAVKETFVRAQYGTTISITPTIHLRDEDCFDEDGEDYVTLETDITFDTIHPGCSRDRPDVTRRHIKNQVQVADGTTVVLGNLRRKVSSDKNQGLPFLGELPGIGKLFSETSIKDNSTEMFIFITPHIVRDPKDELIKMRQELLSRRPGDLPYFLECVEDAHRYEKERLMTGSLRVLLGVPPSRYYIPEGEYDGR